MNTIIGNSRACKRLENLIADTPYRRKVIAYINQYRTFIKSLQVLPLYSRKRIGITLINQCRDHLKNGTYDLKVPQNILDHVHQISIEYIRDHLIRNQPR